MKEAEDKVVTPFSHAGSGTTEPRARMAVPPMRAVIPVSSQEIHVGPWTRLNGGLNTQGVMIVDGRVEEADITADRLAVSHIGEVQGYAKVHRAEISGVFDGDLVAADEVIIRPTVRVGGTVR